MRLLRNLGITYNVTLGATVIGEVGLCVVQFLQEQGGVNFERLRTPYWVAPEVLKHGPHSTASDVYAFGMMMYEVLFRQEPFPGETAEVGYTPSSPPSSPTRPSLLDLLVKTCQETTSSGTIES